MKRICLKKNLTTDTKTNRHSVLVGTERLEFTNKTKALKEKAALSKKITRIIRLQNDNYSTLVHIIQKFVFDIEFREFNKYNELKQNIDKEIVFLLYQYTGTYTNDTLYFNKLYFIGSWINDLIFLATLNFKKIKYTGIESTIENIEVSNTALMREIRLLGKIDTITVSISEKKLFDFTPLKTS